MNPTDNSAIQEAMARRGMTGGGSSPQMQQPAPMPPQDPSQAMAQGQSAPQKFEPQTKEDLIVQALIEQLKRSDDLKKEQLKMSAPMPPQQPPMQ